MGRRRRRHTDPAKLPRRRNEAAPPGDALPQDQWALRGKRRGPSRDREQAAQREGAARQLVRAHESLARATAVLGAAIVYFGAWLADVVLGLFAPPRGFELTHPLFLIGVAAILASAFAARWLARSVPTRRLLGLGALGTLALGAVLVVFLGVAVVSAGPRRGELAIVVAGVAGSWLLAAIWIALLGRRVRHLLPLARGGGTGVVGRIGGTEAEG